MNSTIIIVGGGLAGLTAGIHLSKIGHTVTVIERNEYPKHKVCGEFISNEVLPYLKWLGINVFELNPAKITRTQISTEKGEMITSNLPLGGFGISRFALDYFLVKHAVTNGCTIINDSVVDISFRADTFTVNLSENGSLTAQMVIGAFGKRSNIDQKMQRPFVQKKSPWLAVKAHYVGNFPNDIVALHNFNGGYCGVSKVEDDKINICYLAHYDAFKKFRNIADFQHEAVCKNPHLKSIFANSEMVFDAPITISQISFDYKNPIENHILMVGDTAGLIHPLCGNGMAMAVHSAKIASELIDDYLKGVIKTRTDLEEQYESQWNLNFKSRIRTGKILGQLLQNEKLSGLLMGGLTKFPSLLPRIIRKTHGKPITLDV